MYFGRRYSPLGLFVGYISVANTHLAAVWAKILVRPSPNPLASFTLMGVYPR